MPDDVSGKLLYCKSNQEVFTTMKKLEHLRWKPRNVTHLGCIKGCLNYLGIEVSDAWLYGATGHAFVINIAENSI